MPAGTPVTLRFRTFHNDVTGVNLRVYDLNAGGQRVCQDVPGCQRCRLLPGRLGSSPAISGKPPCRTTAPNNLWYRFIVTDGSDTDYYADNTAALDGGLGSADRRSGRQQLCADVLRPGLHRPGLGEERRDLPDLPRPLPQRAQATTIPRPATCATTTRCSRCPGARCPKATAATMPMAAPTAPGALTPPRPTAARPKKARAAAITWAAT